MSRPSPIQVSTDLDVTIGGARVTLTPSQGLDLAEDLARKSFRRALAEEAALPSDRTLPPAARPSGDG